MCRFPKNHPKLQNIFSRLFRGGCLQLQPGLFDSLGNCLAMSTRVPDPDSLGTITKESRHPGQGPNTKGDYLYIIYIYIS